MWTYTFNELYTLFFVYTFDTSICIANIACISFGKQRRAEN
jgi:hypothetical protein